MLVFLLPWITCLVYFILIFWRNRIWRFGPVRWLATTKRRWRRPSSSPSSRRRCTGSPRRSRGPTIPPSRSSSRTRMCGPGRRCRHASDSCNLLELSVYCRLYFSIFSNYVNPSIPKENNVWWRGFYEMDAFPGAFSTRKRMPPRRHDKITIFIKIAPIANLLCLAIFRWIKWWFSSRSAPDMQVCQS